MEPHNLVISCLLRVGGERNLDILRPRMYFITTFNVLTKRPSVNIDMWLATSDWCHLLSGSMFSLQANKDVNPLLCYCKFCFWVHVNIYFSFCYWLKKSGWTPHKWHVVAFHPYWPICVTGSGSNVPWMLSININRNLETHQKHNSCIKTAQHVEKNPIVTVMYHAN